MKKTIVVISGYSAVGKGVVVNRLLNDSKDYELIKSYTSRKCRGNDNYHYVSKCKFLELQENEFFLESNFYRGSNNYYGTPAKEVFNQCQNNKIPILEIDYHGLIQLKQNKKLDDFMIKSIFLVAEPEELHRRMINRMLESGVKERMIPRLEAAMEEAKVVNDLYDLVIYNENILVTAEKINRFILKEDVEKDTFDSNSFQRKMEKLIANLRENGYE